MRIGNYWFPSVRVNAKGKLSVIASWKIGQEKHLLSEAPMHMCVRAVSVYVL